MVFSLPMIRVMGRSAECLDFESNDESGNYLGIKVYSRQVTESLHGSGKVRWWEIYKIKEAPAGMVVVIIPRSDVLDIAKFKAEVLRSLTNQNNDVPETFQIAKDLGRLELVIAHPDAYAFIQEEIDRRVKEGRSYGQLKPKHIYVMESREEYARTIQEKYGGRLYRI